MLQETHKCEEPHCRERNLFTRVPGLRGINSGMLREACEYEERHCRDQTQVLGIKEIQRIQNSKNLINS